MEMAVLISLVLATAQKQHWIGGIKVGPEWKWGGSWDPLTYSAWSRTQPNGGIESCIENHCKRNVDPGYGYGWHDQDCIDELSFICECKL